MEEFRDVEGLVKRGDVHVARVELIDGELLRWRLCLRFKPDTLIQQGLNRYGEMLGDSSKRNILDLRLYFPPDYPTTPPVAMIHEPRLKDEETLNRLVSFNGKLHTLLLSGDWKDTCRVRDIVSDAQLRLVVANADIAEEAKLVRPYHGKCANQENCPLVAANYPTVNNFDRTVNVISSSFAREQYGNSCIGNIEHSDRISLSTGVMKDLYSEESVSPIIFEMRTQEGRVRHMGISDTLAFVDYLPIDTVIAPDWVVAELYVHSQFPVRLRCVELPAIKTLLLQPRSKQFYKDMEAAQTDYAGSAPAQENAMGKNTQAVLNAALRDSKLTALTVHCGVRIKIPVGGRQIDHMFEVLDVNPSGAVRLISSTSDSWEIQFKVEFAPAPDHEDDEDRGERDARKTQRLQAIEQEKEKRLTEMEEQKREERFNTSLMQRLQIEDETPNIGKQGEIAVKLGMPDGKSLDGKFKAGMKVQSIIHFIMLNSEWVESKGILMETIKLTMPRHKAFENSDVLTAEVFHRTRINVAEGAEDAGEAEEEIYLPEDTEMAEPALAAVAAPLVSSPTSHVDANSDLPRTTTDALEQAWLNSGERAQKRTNFREEDAQVCGRGREGSMYNCQKNVRCGRNDKGKVRGIWGCGGIFWLPLVELRGIWVTV